MHSAYNNFNSPKKCKGEHTHSSSKLDKLKYIEKYINTKVDISGIMPFGFSSMINKNGDEYVYTYGKRDIENDLPFEKDSIYRMASQSKFMGVVGFMKLVDEGKISLNDTISKYIPEFGINNMGVIKPIVIKDVVRVIYNPFKTTIDSDEIFVTHNNSNFKDGDLISFEWSNGSLERGHNKLPNMNGIPGFEVFNIHEIYNVSSKGYWIKTNGKATKESKNGGFVKIKIVEKGVKRSIYLCPDGSMVCPKIKTYYYEIEPLKRELTVMDVITHGLGWSYYSYSALYMSFGYSCNEIKRNIQSGIWNELGIPVGIPTKNYKCGIISWAKTSANVPLLYQPGEDWSYGPQISILGALIEIITGMDVQDYFKKELWNPLGMKDTGFFIYDNDPDKEGKMDRLCKLYINMPKILIKLLGQKKIPFPPMYFAECCIYEGPRSLIMLDSGMHTTVVDYLKFMKMLLNNGKNEKGVEILSQKTIDIIRTYSTQYDVSNLATMSKYASTMHIPGSKSELDREKIIQDMKWGFGVGNVKGCSNKGQSNKGQCSDGKCFINDSENLAITWAGVMGTRFLIDFCSGTAYNVGTNVIGPPAGTIDDDLIELMYKDVPKDVYDMMVKELIC